MESITVLTLKHPIASPFCTCQEVERRGSGDFSHGYDERAQSLTPHVVCANRSKESIALRVRKMPSEGYRT